MKVEHQPSITYDAPRQTAALVAAPSQTRPELLHPLQLTKTRIIAKINIIYRFMVA